MIRCSNLVDTNSLDNIHTVESALLIMIHFSWDLLLEVGTGNAFFDAISIVEHQFHKNGSCFPQSSITHCVRNILKSTRNHWTNISLGGSNFFVSCYARSLSEPFLKQNLNIRTKYWLESFIFSAVSYIFSIIMYSMRAALICQCYFDKNDLIFPWRKRIFSIEYSPFDVNQLNSEAHASIYTRLIWFVSEEKIIKSSLRSSK